MRLKRGAGDEDREFFLTEGGFLISNGAFSSCLIISFARTSSDLLDPHLLLTHHHFFLIQEHLSLYRQCRNLISLLTIQYPHSFVTNSQVCSASRPSPN